METKITEEDVIAVAQSIGKELTVEEVGFVLDEYPFWQENQPTSMWNEIVEDIIYFIFNHR